MPRAALVLLLVAAPALADVPSPVPKATCSAPASCIACPSYDEACRSGALDAGMTVSCSGQAGARTFDTFCPAGVTATRGCGCSASEAGTLALLGALILGLGRRVAR